MKLEKLTPTNYKYRRVNTENKAFLNTNTFLTLDNIIGMVRDFLEMRTNSLIRDKLIDIEIPDRARFQQDMTESNNMQLNKNLLPRAVMTMDLTPIESDLINIPTNNYFPMLHSALTSRLETFRMPNIKDEHLRIWDDFRDINLSIMGKIKNNSINIAFTVLLDNRIESMELYKQFSMIFGNNRIHHVYRYETRTVDGEAAYGSDQILHTPKVFIPNEIINLLKKTFKVDTYENSDELLLRLLQKNSSNGINREVDGSTKEPIWFTRHRDVPTLVATSLQRTDEVKDKSSTSAVRIEFELTYVDITAFVLMNKYTIMEPKNPENQFDGNDLVGEAINIALEGIVSKYPERIDECQRFDNMTIGIEEADITDEIVQIDIIKLLTNYNNDLRDYILHINSNNSIVDERFYKIIIKHAGSQSVDVDMNSSKGTYYVYEDMMVYDEISKINDSIHILFYINFVDFTNWKRAAGILPEENLSTQFMK